MEEVFHFVRHEYVPEWEKLGWNRLPALDGCRHGEWSALMLWRGSGEIVFGPKDGNGGGSDDVADGRDVHGAGDIPPGDTSDRADARGSRSPMARGA